MSRNTEKIQQKLDEIRQVQDDIITKPATANKGQNEIIIKIIIMNKKMKTSSSLLLFIMTKMDSFLEVKFIV